MSVSARIEEKLTEAFRPERLIVLNESAQHAGHQPGMTADAQTHMRIRIISDEFVGKTRVARHRAITDLLKSEFEAGLHALAIEAAAPGEPTRW